MSWHFADRIDAGRQLAAALLADWPGLSAGPQATPVRVLGIPRGGVVVAAQVAAALAAPLDALVSCKIRHPAFPEAAIGAIAPGGEPVLTVQAAAAGLTAAQVALAVEHARMTWQERNRTLRGGEPSPAVAGHTVLLVDDGIATGSTARAALIWLRASGATGAMVAVPCGPIGADRELADVADRVFCLATADPFWAVGQFYGDFRSTGDDEVIACLARFGPGARRR